MRQRHRHFRAIVLICNFLLHHLTLASPVFGPQFLTGGTGRNIRHLPCVSRRTGETGVCMFAFTCAKANGTHLGTCIDRFYFGSCCKIDGEPDIFPQDNTIDIDNALSIPKPFVTTAATHTYESNDIPGNVDRPKPSLKPGNGVVTVSVITKATESSTSKTPDQIKTKPTKIATKKPVTVEPTTESIRLSTFQTVQNASDQRTTVLPSSTTEAASKRPQRPNTSNLKPATSRPKPPSPSTSFSSISHNAVTNSTITSFGSSYRPSLFSSISTPSVNNHIISNKKPYPTTNFTKRPISTFQAFGISRPGFFSTTHRNTTISSLTSVTHKTSLTEDSRPLTTQPRPTISKKPSPSTITRWPTSTPSTITPASTKTTISNSTLTTSLSTTTSLTATPSSITNPSKKPQTTISTKRPTTIKRPLTTATRRPSITSTIKRPTITISRRNVTSSVSARPTTPAIPVKITTKATTTTTTTSVPSSSTKITTDLPITKPTTINIVTAKPLKQTEGTTPSSTTLNVITPSTNTIKPTIPSDSTGEMSKKPVVSSSSSEIISKKNVTTPAWNSLTVTTVPNEIDTEFINATEQITTSTPGIVTWTSFPDELESTTKNSSEHSTSSSSSSSVAPEIAATEWTPLTTPNGWIIIQSSTTDKSDPESYLDVKPAAASTTTTTMQIPITMKPTTESTTTRRTMMTTTHQVTTQSTMYVDMLSSLATVTVAPEFTEPPFVPLNMSSFKDVCGRRIFPEARIVGGDRSTFGRWPWQISLRQWRTSTYLHKCGAALLNENWAITAAHCVQNVLPSDLLLRIGEHDLGNEEEPYGFQERRVQIVASHPNFDPRTFEFDLALMRFYETVLPFQPNVLPVCVPDDDEDYVGQTAFVTGWGRLYEDGPLPSILQEVAVPVINNSVCEGMYRNAGYIEHIPHIFICAGWRKGGFDSCEGDSGGPLVIQRKRDRRWVLAGVISWGIGCAEPNQPGVYTRISEFREWINQILQF